MPLEAQEFPCQWSPAPNSELPQDSNGLFSYHEGLLSSYMMTRSALHLHQTFSSHWIEKAILGFLLWVLIREQWVRHHFMEMFVERTSRSKIVKPSAVMQTVHLELKCHLKVLKKQRILDHFRTPSIFHVSDYF